MITNSRGDFYVLIWDLGTKLCYSTSLIRTFVEQKIMYLPGVENYNLIKFIDSSEGVKVQTYEFK